MKIRVQITNGDWHTLDIGKCASKASFMKMWMEKKDAYLFKTAVGGIYIRKGSIIAVYFD